MTTVEPLPDEVRAADVAVCVVVPHGAGGAASLVDAVRHHHPGWRIGAVWCGDPQLRPDRPAAQWWDGLDPVGADDRERELVRFEPLTVAWRRGARTARSLLADGHSDVVMLLAGAVAVLGPIEGLVEGTAPDAPLSVVPLVLTSLPDDDLAPTAAALERAGGCSTDVVAVCAGGDDALASILDRLEADGAEVGRVLDAAVGRFGARRVVDPRYGASVWRWDADDPVLVDLPGFDASRPWLLAPSMEGVGRIPVVGSERVSRAVTAGAAQLARDPSPLALPGGWRVDAHLRAAVSLGSAANGTSMPPPWTDPAGFRRWLAPWFWAHLAVVRPDLRQVFPHPATDDADAFRVWQRRAFVDDSEVPVLLDVVGVAADPITDPIGAPAVPRSPDRYAPAVPLDVEPVRRSDGVNLVGYITRQASLGDVARRLWTALDAADVPVSTIASDRTASPLLPEPPAVDQRVAFDTSLAVVTADQFPLLARDRPELFAATRRMIGYWFWELEVVPRAMRDAIRLVDEVWVGSRFVRDAFAAVTSAPVRHVPIPVSCPSPSGRRRTDFPELADVGDRPMFLVVFDHLSVTERKNPVGAIQAFRRAFAPGAGPVLVVKSMNGTIRWREHQAVLAAADGHPDIRCIDGSMDRADLMALVRTSDCLVSLHRSEGLGLHLAEAMWLGTPTIATRYSGNLDFMDDDCSLLVDAQRIAVGAAGQGVYPPTAIWADPDVDAAAVAMRRLVGDTDLAAQLSACGLARMRAQPTIAETGRAVAGVLGLDAAHRDTVVAR